MVRPWPDRPDRRLRPCVDDGKCQCLAHVSIYTSLGVLWQDRSQTSLGLGLILLIFLPNTVCADKTLCDMIMWNVISTCVLLCNKYRNSAKRYWSSLFWCFWTKLFLDNKHACFNRGVFSVMYSCCCLTLGLNILVLFPSPIYTLCDVDVIGCQHRKSYVSIQTLPLVTKFHGAVCLQCSDHYSYLLITVNYSYTLW